MLSFCRAIALGLYSGSLLLTTDRVVRRPQACLRATRRRPARRLLGNQMGLLAPHRHGAGCDEFTAVTGLERWLGTTARSAPYRGEFHHARDRLRIARAHVGKLRVIAHVALFLAPLILLGVVVVGPPLAAEWTALLAVLSAALGAGVERWLFFAEAQHTSMLFYGRAS